ncbi:unnamed protein product [Candida verbasci]|uniref:Sorting nexin MVP1 n=1 Tax=Candida verbasci TaxID=1227364 RepID=A0A9W4U081_9ASCO|nr:unnamed protein product [Candida verbasci]
MSTNNNTNSILYGQDDIDPWADNNNAANTDSSTNLPFQSTYLTSSQLLNKQSDQLSKLSIKNVPNSYEIVYSNSMNQIQNVNDFEYIIIDKLISLGYLTTYQKSKLLNCIYDNDLLPITLSNNFYQILGLIALEIDVPGSGDFVTLQFKLNNLPNLPDNFAKSFENIINDDPLMGNSSRIDIEQKQWTKKQPKHDPILKDHSENNIMIEEQNKVKDSIVSSGYIEKYIDDLKDQFKPLFNDVDLIKIKEIPEKEGILFKHINYIITHDLKLGERSSSGTKKVIRRYSDFVWLLEFLNQKYSFRVIPGIPPKKFSASPDSQFLQRRRRGLHRFLNQLVKHPIFKEEPVVITFLTVPTDISTWKKQAKIDYSLEFKGQKIETNFINSIWPNVGENFLKQWGIAESNIKFLIEKWTKIIILVERYERRHQQIAFDNGKFDEILNQFKDINTKVYCESDDLSSINNSLSNIASFFQLSSTNMIDESYLINTKTLEKFKNYLDYLHCLSELFERCKKLSVNQIDILDKRIKENEIKFKKIQENDVDIKGQDITKLRQLIINDKQEIFQQLNKDWLIKQCCFQEFIMFQETQFLISEVWLEFIKDRSKFQNKLGEMYEDLNSEIVNDMPTSR